MSRSRASAPRRPAPRPAAPRGPAGLPLAHPAHLALLALAAVCVGAIVLVRIQDTDLWQHLAVGRAVWTTFAVPRTQVWSWPAYGAPDVNASWGFEALLWPFWNAGGLAGLNAWRVLSALLVFGLAWAAARRMGARGLAPVVVAVLGALAAHRRLQVRPETLALVLFAAGLYALAAWRRGSRAWAMALVPLALAWANCHISWPVLLAAILAHALAAMTEGPERRRAALELLGIGALAFAATLVNPWGVRALAPPFEFLAHQRQGAIFANIGELQPLDWSRNVRTGLPLLMLGWPLAMALRAPRGGLDRAGLLMFAGLALLALRVQRFVPFFAVAAVVHFGSDLDALLAGLPRALSAGAAWARAGLAALACAVMLVVRAGDPGSPVTGAFDPNLQPGPACDFMTAHGVRGRGFNHFWMGGYLLHRFWPQRDRLPFMDVHQSGGPEIQDAYVAALSDPASWRALDARWRFDWVMLWRVTMPGDRSVETLDRDPTFRLVFLDDVAALYVRRSGPLAAVADSLGYAIVRASPAEFGARMQAAAADTALRAALHGELERAAAGSPLDAWAVRWRDATAAPR